MVVVAWLVIAIVTVLPLLRYPHLLFRVFRRSSWGSLCLTLFSHHSTLSFRCCEETFFPCCVPYYRNILFLVSNSNLLLLKEEEEELIVLHFACGFWLGFLAFLLVHKKQQHVWNRRELSVAATQSGDRQQCYHYYWCCCF